MKLKLANLPYKIIFLPLTAAVVIGGFSFAVVKTVGPRIVPLTDHYSVSKGHELIVAAANGVLANDFTRGTSRGLMATLSDGTRYGDIILNQDGSFVYKPADCAECVTDRFTYAIFDDKEFVGTITTYINYFNEPESASAPPTIIGGSPFSSEPGTADLVPVDRPDEEVTVPPPAETVGTSPIQAKGTITVINDTAKEHFFVATTRFLTPDDVLFRLDKGTRIPANGSVDVAVTADRPAPPTRFGPTVFTIPGLSKSLQKSIYAKCGAGLVAVVVNKTETEKPDTAPAPAPTPAPDQETAAAPVIAPPSAQDDTYSVAAGGTLVVPSSAGILTNDSDSGNRVLAVAAQSLSAPIHARVFELLSDGSFVYAPQSGWSGIDTFSYRAQANGSQSNVASVSISTIAAPQTAAPPTAAPAATADISPIARDDSYDATANASLGIGAYNGVLRNDYDPDHDQLHVKLPIESRPTHASLFRIETDGFFLYVPETDFSGVDTFTYRATDEDDGVSGIAAVRITVTAPVRANSRNNHPPIQISTPPTLQAQRDVTIAINAPGLLSNYNDTHGDTLSFVKLSDPLHGNLTNVQANGSFTYDPAAGYIGADSFTYAVDDGLGGRLGPITAGINVSPGAHPPVANDDFGPAYRVTMNGTLNVAAPGILANDTDPNGGPLTAVKDSEVANGALALNSNGSFVYTPNPGFTGEDIFTYRAFDGTDYSVAAAWVTILVTAP